MTFASDGSGWLNVVSSVMSALVGPLAPVLLLMAYLPAQRLLIQGDLFDVNWEVYFWGTTYADNVKYRNLVVERDVPIHGRVLPLAYVQKALREQTRNAAALCGRVEAAGLSMPGCPLAWREEDAASP